MATTIQPWGTVHGEGVFRDPTTFREYTLIAADGAVYAALPNNPATLLSLPAGETISERCTFLQAFNVVLLLRGFNADALVMTSIASGFQAVSPSVTGTGTLPIPRALRGVFAANRVWLAREDDTLVASDALDYTHYSPLNDLRINQGTDDRIVTLALFGGDIIVLKGKTVHRLFNLGGALATIQAEEITRRYGCIAADTAVDCGTDLLWLSQEGVASLTLTEQNEIQTAQGALRGKYRMFSEDIGPLIKRIHGQHASKAFAVLWQDRYYIALPFDHAEVFGPELATGQVGAVPVPLIAFGGLIDGQTFRYTKGNSTNLVHDSVTYTRSTDIIISDPSATINLATGDATTASFRRVSKGVNNILAVYDFENASDEGHNGWIGYDEAEGISFKHLFTATYVGKQRLFVVTDDGYVRLWEEGYADRLSVPYTTVTVATLPVTADTIQVNSGDLVTFNLAALENSALTWSAGLSGTVAGAGQRLYASQNAGSTAGYSANKATVWSAPNTIAVSGPSSNGVRFFATNGVLPDVVTSGTWASIAEVFEQEIVSTFVSRGYANPDGELSDYHFLALDVQGWRPNFDVTLLSDGVNEEVAVAAGVTKSRTAYYFPFTAPPYVDTNVNGDFATQGRQDYSIQPTSSSYAFTPSAGVRGDFHQEAREPWEVNLSGRAARLKLVNRQGRVRLLAARLAETVDDMMAGPIAA